MNNSCPENRELLGYLLFQRKIIWYSTNLKDVLLCFFTFWILVSVVCMFRHKTIYKFTNPVQRENYNKRLVWTNVTELFSWLAGGYNTWLSTACFKIETLVRVFLYHCISDGNQLFSEHFECHFNFLLHIISDKAAFVSGALLCVQRYRGYLSLYHSNSASCWQRIYLHICGLVMRGWRLYARPLRMIRRSVGRLIKKMHSDYLRVGHGVD